MSQSLAHLNALPAEAARSEFLKCCGAQRWAQEMTAARPFAGLDELLTTADRVWRSMSEADWQEAFRAHPKIGEKKAAQTQSHEEKNWSAQEQSGVQTASPDTMAQLAEGNRAYEEKFGFIFIVCATGKSTDEMLATLNSRINNDAETELPVAAEEQRKIARLRLEKLLSQ
ncbi:MAG TPA: 2-oxo-4-hydroxy-4-carboxy-5-ureidoimidazoline decarboxylase [Pyrinomonadaceae bacterium]|nr:2-oxo-4-hydroxy-4-carboxy-5-ureidoimidazoline decarboxylase [Pyrinomonadaceae bacterium]